MKRPCSVCGAYRRQVKKEAASGQIVAASKTAIKGAGMMLGLIPKELPNVGDEPRQGPASEPDPQKPG